VVEYERMTETPQPKQPESDSQGGVFGNLPDARPGTRSPRRASSSKPKAAPKAKSAAAKAKPAAKPKATPKPPQAARPVDPPPPPRPADPERPIADQQPGGLADVAWAGIAVAAEAATLGVRLASRAIEAVRGNSERD
jgi:hypothetical protein